ncbi:preprotein translocase subunit YajC [Gordonia neofelifaecis]|uniref:Preprotein translocase, YajC subunit n=1 Tax=Gordonia neofelifaecis NRRL B-59395 TaxID=644548 RepID=F1YG68_9ACTN|nr:preprotein translocase subunit YajC [Gordonia neofelifaecis]EGD56041.1 preprotein translocase, YajC subunit [Gordonia neofelifaecis NRRL B-59395]
MESLILPLMLALMAGFMFFSIRNQKKRAAAMNEMQSSLEPGARVQLHSGLFATVVDAGDGGNEVVKLELAPGVVTEWNRLAIREVVSPEDDAVDADGSDADGTDAGVADSDTYAVPAEDPQLEKSTLDSQKNDDEKNEEK